MIKERGIRPQDPTLFVKGTALL